MLNAKSSTIWLTSRLPPKPNARVHLQEQIDQLPKAYDGVRCRAPSWTTAAQSSRTPAAGLPLLLQRLRREISVPPRPHPLLDSRRGRRYPALHRETVSGIPSADRGR